MTPHEITYCDECGIELEAGQVGKCSDCLQGKEYTFAELSEASKDNARDMRRYSQYYLDDEWWDSVFEDAAQVATILGLDIYAERQVNGKSRQVIGIQFSGFSSQGDGASVQGSYEFNPSAITEIKAFCGDAELVRIATELTVLQLARRVSGKPFFTANITTSGRYGHSNTMNVSVNAEDDDDIPEALEDEVTQLMKDLADWIYKSLENEYEYLMSDKCVDEQLADEKFDEFGNSI